MADQISVSGPVSVVDNSRERVAFEIAKYIDGSEPQTQDKFLELYARCLLTTSSPSLGVAAIKDRAKGG